MAVRKQCNRYKTEPFGTDYNDVLKRAKRFFKDGTFMMVKYGNVWTSTTVPIGFKKPENAIYFTKNNGRWENVI